MATQQIENMSINIGYKKICTINLLHEYYSDWRSPDLVLLPTQETLRVLKNYNLLAKPVGNSMIILAAVTKADGTLKIPIPDADGFRLTFYLQSNSNLFYNRTDLPLEPRSYTRISPNRRGYYFDNLKNNTFKPTGYPGTESTLKTLMDSNNKAVTNTDEIYYIPSIFRVEFTAPTNSFTLDIRDELGVNVVPQIAKNSPEAFTSYELDVTRIVPPGYYKISIDGGGNKKVYISNEVFHNSPFAVVEILQTASVPTAYSFVKSAGTKVKDGANYFLWFKNRIARWRYVFGGTPPTAVTKTASTFVKTGNIYESNGDIAIKEDYAAITMTKNGDKTNVTNPDGSVIKAKITSNVIDYFFAEVHL